MLNLKRSSNKSESGDKQKDGTVFTERNLNNTRPACSFLVMNNHIELFYRIDFLNLFGKNLFKEEELIFLLFK